jgi:hypothetical protein
MIQEQGKLQEPLVISPKEQLLQAFCVKPFLKLVFRAIAW